MENEDKSFWKKQPEELNVSESLIHVALFPVAMLGGFVIFGSVIGGVNKLIESRKAKKQPVELDIVEPIDEVQ